MIEALESIRSLQERAANIGLSDTGLWTNQNLSFARAVPDMLALAEVMLMGGIERKESRGSHYRTDYPDRVDDPFLASTVAKWNGGQPSIEFEPSKLVLSSLGLARTARSKPHNHARRPASFSPTRSSGEGPEPPTTPQFRSTQSWQTCRPIVPCRPDGGPKGLFAASGGEPSLSSKCANEALSMATKMAPTTGGGTNRPTIPATNEPMAAPHIPNFPRPLRWRRYPRHAPQPPPPQQQQGRQ